MSGARSVLHPLRRPRPGSVYEGLSLYARVVIVNAAVLVAATLILSLTPAYVPAPHTVTDVVVIVLGVLVVVGANALLLRLTFTSLAGLMRAMRAIDLLRPGSRLEATGGVEARQVIATFNEMIDQLEHERLESNRRAHLAREAERRRIGQELHDEIGQRLTAILLELQRTHDDSPFVIQVEIAHTQELTRQTLDQVGRLAWLMRPAVLDDLGLAKALEALVDGVRDATPATTTLDLTNTPFRLDPDVEIVLYRVAQEGLTNALRHSEAANIRLELAGGEGGEVHLQLTDDGRGLDPSAAEGPGLRGMRERALAVGADLSIESVAGGGVTLRLSVTGENAEP